MFVDNDLRAYRASPGRGTWRCWTRSGPGAWRPCWPGTPTGCIAHRSSWRPTSARVTTAEDGRAHTVQAGPLDLSSPSGRMVARQLGAVARYESEHRSERVRRRVSRTLSRVAVLVGRDRSVTRTTGSPCGSPRPRRCALRWKPSWPVPRCAAVARDLTATGLTTTMKARPGMRTRYARCCCAPVTPGCGTTRAR